MYKIYLTLGDWANNGHGKSEKILLESNKPISSINESYIKSVKLTLVNFNNYRHIQYDYKKAEKFEFCVSYEDCYLNHYIFEKLAKFGLTRELLESFGAEDWKERVEGQEPKWFINIDCFALLFIWFVKLSDKELEIKKIDSSIPELKGFGYGLFE